MSDHVDALPEWMVEALRQPVVTNAARQARIMELVRVHARRRRLGWSAAARLRRGLVTPAFGLALAAGLAGIMVAAGLGDLPRYGGQRAAAASHVQVLGDTISATLHDTLRLVRFVLDAPAASRVALAGDFNGWSRTATPLRATARAGEWSAVVALPRGRNGYAFVVDDTQWVSAPALPERDGSRGTGQRVVISGGDTT
jgi:hypothetical protein